MTRHRSHRFTKAAAALLVIGAAAVVQAQDAPPPAAVTPAPVETIVPPRLSTIVDIRPAADVQRDLDAAVAMRQNAENEERRLRDNLTRQKGEIDVRKREIETLKARADAAGKQKLEVEKQSYVFDKKRAELSLKVLEKRTAIDEARVELARSQRELAEAAVEVAQHELEIVRKHDEWMQLSQTATLAEGATRLVGLELDIHGLERSTLESMRKRSDRQQDVVKREHEIIQSQLRLLDAQRDAFNFANRRKN